MCYREVQDECRQCGVHGLWNGDVLGDCRSDCVFGLCGVSGELKFFGVEYSLHLQCWLHRPRRRSLFGVLTRIVQDADRQRGV